MPFFFLLARIIFFITVAVLVVTEVSSIGYCSTKVIQLFHPTVIQPLSAPNILCVSPFV